MFRKLHKRKEKVNHSKGIEAISHDVSIPEGMFERCPACGVIESVEKLQQTAWVCASCGYHGRLHIAQRAKLIFDSFQIFNHRMRTKDPLNFPGYLEKVDALIESSGVYDAVVCAEATIEDRSVIAVIMDPNFMMGSMGTVVGEKITRAFERALQKNLPVVLFSASGGARMQEGVMSLMQMVKTTAAVNALSRNGGLYINVLTDPTTGGVTASFAMLADIILAEPGALIGFAGPRVIKDTINRELPEGFQRSEFLLEKGFVDMIVKRSDLKQTLSQLLALHERKR